MKQYLVYYTFGACIPVDAESEDDAERIVEEMPDEELIDLARDGFVIHDVDYIRDVEEIT